MILWSFLSLAVPFIPAYMMVTLALGRTSGPMDYVLRFFLCLGVALGISSCTYFLWLTRLVPGLPGLFFTEVVVFSFLCAIMLWFQESRQAIFTLLPGGATPSTRRAVPRDERVPVSLLLCFGLVLFLAVCAIFLVLANKPHGSGDSYAIWNLRARFLFRGGDRWTDGFSPLLAWSHPDYPLLIPGAVARWWTYMGFETIKVPQFISLFFTLATAGLLISSLSVLRSVRQGLVAGLFLFSTDYFMRLGASQYADVPIGFFMLATVVAFSFRDSDGERSLMVYSLAGITAGLAAWTKNEGALFVLAVLAARIVSAILVRTEDWKGWIKETAFFVAGLAPILAVLVFFKLRYAPPNDLFQDRQAGVMLARMTDVLRYVTIGKAFLSEIVRWGNGLFPILLVYVFFSGVKHDSRNSRLVATCLVILAFMLCGYFMVYVRTPNDLAWHLGTSLRRLLLQLWPTFLLAVFLVVTPLEGLRRT